MLSIYRFVASINVTAETEEEAQKQIQYLEDMFRHSADFSLWVEDRPSQVDDVGSGE